MVVFVGTLYFAASSCTPGLLLTSIQVFLVRQMATNWFEKRPNGHQLTRKRPKRQHFERKKKQFIFEKDNNESQNKSVPGQPPIDSKILISWYWQRWDPSRNWNWWQTQDFGETQETAVKSNFDATSEQKNRGWGKRQRNNGVSHHKKGRSHPERRRGGL